MELDAHDVPAVVFDRLDNPVIARRDDLEPFADLRDAVIVAGIDHHAFLSEDAVQPGSRVDVDGMGLGIEPDILPVHLVHVLDPGLRVVLGNQTDGPFVDPVDLLVPETDSKDGLPLGEGGADHLVVVFASPGRIGSCLAGNDQGIHGGHELRSLFVGRRIIGEEVRLRPSIADTPLIVFDRRL